MPFGVQNFAPLPKAKLLLLSSEEVIFGSYFITVQPYSVAMPMGNQSRGESSLSFGKKKEIIIKMHATEYEKGP